jgi:imidazolonepropionase-like amidohydrolase
LRDVALYAVERGMSPERVLEAMTSGAARMFDLEDRVGSIAPGCDGDVVIFSGYPFDPATTIRRVIVNGEDVE